MAEKLCPLMRGLVLQSFAHTQPADGPQPCIEHRCRWYIEVMGKHPQRGEPVSQWGCAVEFTPLILIAQAQETRQFAAAVESARNADRENAAAMASSTLEIANSIGEAASAMRARAERPVTIEQDNPRGLLGRLRLAFKGE